MNNKLGVTEGRWRCGEFPLNCRGKEALRGRPFNLLRKSDKLIVKCDDFYLFMQISIEILQFENLKLFSAIISQVYKPSKIRFEVELLIFQTQQQRNPSRNKQIA